MALFKIPQREELNINKIVAKAKEEQERPTIKLKGTSLTDTIATITNRVNTQLGKEKDNYICITSDEEFIEYCRQAVKDGIVAIDTETTGLDTMLVKLVGVCIYSPSQKPAYVPVGHISTITEMPVPNQVSIGAIKEGLELINNSSTKQIYHNSYYDKMIIWNNLGLWMNVSDDTLIMAWYLNENEAHGLKYLYNKYIANGENDIHTFSDLFDGIPFCYIPYSVAYIYGAFDSYMTMKLYLFFNKYLDKNCDECKDNDLERVSDVYNNVEKPLLNVLAKMKRRGIKFDFDRAKELKNKYLLLKKDAEKEFYNAVEPYKEQIKLRQQIKSDIEYPINYNSPSQLKILIYDIIQAGVIYRKEPTGTGKHVIDEILNNNKWKDTHLYKIAQALQEVKKYDKLIGSFIDKLSEDAKKHDGRIFCDFNQCGTNTLRLSSSNPNLQQVPSKNDDIRNMFIPEEDCVLVNLDFSQQEMMAVACLANDEKMLQAFHLNRDIYSHVASIAFKVSYEDCLEFNKDGSVNKEGKVRRKKAKAICLGIVYGKGVPAIADDLHVDIETAQEIKDSILEAFPQLAQYLQDVVEYGKQHGYVKNYFGVKRRLPDLLLPEYVIEFDVDMDSNSKKYYNNLYLSKLKKCYSLSAKNEIIGEAKQRGVIIHQNGGLIAQAIRNSYNSPVQSTAAILTKMAMNNIDNNKRLKELGVELVLTIHDEVALNVPKKNAYEAIQIAKKEFLGAGKDLQADLKCDIEIAECWAGESLRFNEKHELVK